MDLELPTVLFCEPYSGPDLAGNTAWEVSEQRHDRRRQSRGPATLDRQFF